MKRTVRIALLSAMACVTLNVLSSSAQAALVGYWQFQSTDPVGTALDSAGTAQNGTFNGGAEASVVVDGTRGDVLSLNPSGTSPEGGYIAIPDMGAFTQTTWSTWAYLRSDTTGTGGWPMFMTGPTGGYEFRFFSTSRQPEIINGGNIAQSATPLALNSWHQITHTSDGSTNFALYVDGVSVDTGTGTEWTGGTVNLGRRMNGTHYFNGLLDEVQIWNQGLSEGKVAALYDPVLDYDANQLDSLFSTFDAMGSQNVGGIDWSYITGLTGHNQGENWQVGQLTFLQLDGSGNGLIGVAPVPEPSTGALMLLGCLVLSRRRRCTRAIRS